MRITCLCEHCGKKLRALESMLGKKAKCPSCGLVSLLVASESAESARVAPEPAPAPAPAKPAPAKALPAKANPVKPAPAKAEPLPPADEFDEAGFEAFEPPPEKPKGRRPLMADDDVAGPDEDEPPRRGRDRDRDRDRGGPGGVPNSQMGLRSFVLILGIVGSAYAGLLGWIWMTQYGMITDPAIAPFVKLAESEKPQLRRALKELETFGTLSMLLFATAGAGFVGAILGFLRMGLFAALLLIAAMVPPAALFPPTLLFTGFLGLAGLLSLFIVSQRKAQAAADKRAAEGKPPPRSSILGMVGAVLAALVLLGYAAMVGLALSTTAASTAAVALMINTLKALKPGKPPFKDPLDKDKGGDKDKGPDKGKEQSKAPTSFDAIKGDVEKAGAGVKLAKIDLGPGGFDLTIDAPEGTKLKKDFSGVSLVGPGNRFAISLFPGRRELLDARKGLTSHLPFLDAPDLVFVGPKVYDSAKDTAGFTMAKTLGHQDLLLRNATFLDGKPVAHTKAECLLMIKCALTLALKSPPPGDPAAAMKRFRRESEGMEDPAKVVRLNEQATDATLALLAKLPEPDALYLGNAKTTDDGLAYLKGWKKLQVLDLGYRPTEDAGLAHLSEMAGLKTLVVGGHAASDDGFRHLAKLSALESLDARASFGPFKGPGLAHLPALKNLKHLQVSGINLDDASIAHLKGLPGLVSLKIQAYKALGLGYAELKALSALRKLDLGGNGIDDAGLAGLKDLVQLEDLDLNGVKATGDGLAHLKGMKNLKRLSLGYTKVGDKGLAHLAALAALEDLNLSSAPITDAGLEQLKGLKKLKKLDISSCKEVTAKGIALFDAHEQLADLSYFGTKGADYRRPERKPPEGKD